MAHWWCFFRFISEHLLLNLLIFRKPQQPSINRRSRLLAKYFTYAIMGRAKNRLDNNSRKEALAIRRKNTSNVLFGHRQPHEIDVYGHSIQLTSPTCEILSIVQSKFRKTKFIMWDSLAIITWLVRNWPRWKRLHRKAIISKESKFE